MLLNDSFLIKILGNYRKGKLASIRKVKRVYPVDTSIIIAFNQNIDEKLIGEMVETVVVNNLQSKNFWKNSHEVDMINEDVPIEIKYKNKILDKDILGVREFMRKFSVNKGIIVTKNEERRVSVQEGSINLIPAWIFLSKKTE